MCKVLLKMMIQKYQFCAKCVFESFQRHFHINRIYYNKFNYKPKSNNYLEKLIEKNQSKIVYNTFIDTHYPQLNPNKRNFNVRRRLDRKEKIDFFKAQSVEPLPITLKYFFESASPDSSDNKMDDVQPNITHFPYGDESTVHVLPVDNKKSVEASETAAEIADKEIKTRQELYNEADFSKWMTDYENYEEEEEDIDEVNNDKWKINYGTPNPHAAISNVPCGGCGAVLHCKDTAIPGYIPSEIYKNSLRSEGVQLKAIVCQRCHFLQNYNLALQVRVSSEDYPKVLENIKQKHALILLIVDLLDFPCSIWPGIVNLLGRGKPIIVVGNKVDLLPRDSRGYLEKIKASLKEAVEKTMDSKSIANIQHVALISAKTGWGVEELITKLHNVWSTRGDVYLIGCTNVGKSSLFNTLLQSDFCKIQAVDLVQRATTSIWPGTTLNLLKFPILRPSGWRLYVRTKRLKSIRKIQAAENRLKKIQLQQMQDPKYATLIGHLDRTFTFGLAEANSKDPFSVRGHSNASGNVRLGIDNNDPEFAISKWCYDTPGVVQPDQIIHLLTTEELMLTLPRELIHPKTFGIRPGQTLFIAGLGRLDFVDGSRSMKVTVFCSEALPITICYTEDAESIYEEFLGSDVFQVPKGSKERMNKWPRLKAAELFKFVSEDKYISCGDIVLSNAGWVSVTCDPGNEAVFKAWTPEARGIHSRKSLLPRAVDLRGQKIRGSPAYMSNKVYVPK